MTENWKKFTAEKKFNIFLIKATAEDSSPQKRTYSTSEHEIS
jgi:hypothetical protein